MPSGENSPSTSKTARGSAQPAESIPENAFDGGPIRSANASSENLFIYAAISAPVICKEQSQPSRSGLSPKPVKKRYRNRKTDGPKGNKHISVGFGQLEHPFAALTEDKLTKLGLAVEAEHTRLLTRLDQLVRESNPLQALAHFAFYDRFLFDIQKGEAYTPLLQHSVEFFQAYFLTIPVSQLNIHLTPLLVILELNEVLRGLEATYPLRGIGKPRESKDDVRARSNLGQQVRIHTHGVRNAGYYQQVMAQLRRVFGRLDLEFQRLSGLKLSGLITMNERILELIQERSRNHAKLSFSVTRQSTPSKAINAYCDAGKLADDIRSGMLEQCRNESLDVRQARAMCTHHAELSLLQIYTIELADLLAAYPEAVDPKRLLDVFISWSLWPESLVDIDRTHLHLNNPIWKKPIVQIGHEMFFWPMVELFHSFGLEMLEELIRPYQDLWNRYQSRVRANYLEERVRELCREAFPDATILGGSLWKDCEENVEGENDLLVVIDAVAIVIECKSGRISPEGRRGLPERLRHEVKKLIEDAAIQSAQFSRLLIRSNKLLRFSTKRGVVNEVDAAEIKRVVRLNVTLDHFGPLACAVRDMVDAKLIDAAVTTAPTLALVDFENALHVLETPLERLHYFARRADVERNISLFADEEDLLACYLATGLNLGQLEEETKGRLMLGTMHESLQPYLIAHHSGKVHTKPRRKFTNWWRDILARLHSKAFRHWTLAGFAFLDVRHEDQIAFEKAVKRMLKNVKSNWHELDHFNQVLGVNGPAHRRTALCAIGLKHATREKRDEVVGQAIAHAVETAGTEEVVVITFKAESPTWPYGALMVHDATSQE
jgi:hypothetical protein